jgi:hypothetical protein
VSGILFGFWGGLGWLSPPAPQSLHLGVLEPPAAPALEPAQAERPERHALQLHDPVPDRLAHAPHLTLAPLAQGDLDHAGSDLTYPRRRGWAVVEHHPLAQRLERLGRQPPGPHRGAVDLLDAVARMGQQVGQLAVVRQQDQARGIRVEAANRIEPAA